MCYNLVRIRYPERWEKFLKISNLIDSKVEGDEIELVSTREAPGKMAEGAYFQTRHHPHFNLTIAVEGR